MERNKGGGGLFSGPFIWEEGQTIVREGRDKPPSFLQAGGLVGHYMGLRK